jgi:hypothetical protein
MRGVDKDYDKVPQAKYRLFPELTCRPLNPPGWCGTVLVEHRKSNIEHRTLNIEHRTSKADSRFASHFDVQCSTFDVRCASTSAEAVLLRPFGASR